MAFTRQELQAGFRIGECLIEPRQNRIVRGQAEAHLEPRVMDVLVCLAERAGEVVSRETLNEQVWGNVVVTDQAVTNCISELRQHLGDDRAAHRVIETIPKRGYRLSAPVLLAQAEAPAAAGRRWPVADATMLLGIVLLVVALLGGAWLQWRNASAPALTSVAVMRFENAAGNESLDYLALALSDETATMLTKSQGLAVRPFGYEGSVDHIVSGRYYLEDDSRLSLAIEAQHAQQKRVIWRTRITVPSGDLLAMRGSIAEGVRQGLLPALGARALGSSGPTPANDEAYQLYLRSLAVPQQQKLSERAIELLERAVTLDPAFAPAWDALGIRYYALGTWWGGALPARQKSLAAHRKALELDPDLISAARSIVTHRVESGDHEGAYLDARRLLEHFGPGADTHFAVSYVYRYGGMLEDSQRHCELARARDPKNPRLRSCGYAYLLGGKLSPVMDYFLLDEGSYFVHWATVLYALRANDRALALNSTLQAEDDPTRRLMQPCLEGASAAALDAPAAEFFRHWELSDDPETAHALAAMLVYCGHPQEALRMMKRGVDGHYCSYPALDLDPIWTALRNDPEFKRIREKAMACHERFRRIVAAHGAV